VTSYRSRLGLGYLGVRDFPKREKTPLASSRFSSEILLSYGVPILRGLRDSQKDRARIHRIIEQTHIPMDTCLTVSEALRQLGYLEVAERDLKGNHLLLLTEKGKKMVN
jgi:hypothetical protein